MAERIVVDTDVVSYAYKGDSRFVPFAPALEHKELAVFFVTVAELRLWALIRNWGEDRRNDLLKTLEAAAVIKAIGCWEQIRQCPGPERHR